MGQEITTHQFTAEDLREFKLRLHQESELLQQWFLDDHFVKSPPVGGYELEAWLVDQQADAAPINNKFLRQLNNPLVVPELATFNVELNNLPHRLEGAVFSQMADELHRTWASCDQVADGLKARMAMIGILPTLRLDQLNLSNISATHRFIALNEQIFDMRDGMPIELDIEGADRLRLQHHDVMLESAGTSLQLHLQVNCDEAARAFNLSKILSAPMVALSANSPFLFGNDLWDETRIPLFEQSIAVGASDLTKRVTFGIRYANESLMECFEANLARYPILLPRLMDEPTESLAHLRLHNGTIWRWNRPLIGFEEDGTPHLRIEHRVTPSGPSVSDVIANAAFYFGCLRALLSQSELIEVEIPFTTAKNNFYQTARYGLQAEISWQGASGQVGALLQSSLLPLAREGLSELAIDQHEIDYWLGIVEQRVASGQNGATWQRAFMQKCSSLPEMMQRYLDHQMSGKPVHEWPV